VYSILEFTFWFLVILFLDLSDAACSRLILRRIGAFNSATSSEVSRDFLGFHTCFGFGVAGLLDAQPRLHDLTTGVL
jgi:hypothetical protein